MKDKIKIIRVIESFYPVVSGPANQAYFISKELNKKGFDNRILTSEFGVKEKVCKIKHKENIDGIDVYRYKIAKKFMKYFYTPDLKKQLSKHDNNYNNINYDIVCGHSFRSYQTEQGYRYARRYNKPFVLHNHGSLLGYETFVKGWRKWPYKLYDLLSAVIYCGNIPKKADAIVVNTTMEKKEVERYGIDPKKIHVIPVGADPSKIYPNFNKKQKNKLILLCVARITRDRNIKVIIKAAKKLKENGIKFELRIVGGEVKRTDTEQGNYYLELKKMIRKLDLVNHVVLTGAKYDKDLINEYHKADIFIYTSLWENFGQCILEAASAGLPLICTKTGVAPDLINSKTGLIVGFNDTSGIVKGVEKFSNLKRRKEAHKILLRAIKTKYDWNKIADQYAKLYKKLLKKY